MKNAPKNRRTLIMLFHCLGLSCLGGAMFLQVLVFAGMLHHGYFMAVENNPAVLATEVVLTFFALIYYAYTCQRVIRSLAG